MDKELAGWSYPEGSGSWLSVQMEVADMWIAYNFGDRD